MINIFNLNMLIMINTFYDRKIKYNFSMCQIFDAKSVFFFP